MLSPEHLHHLMKLAHLKIPEHEAPIYVNSLNKLIDILAMLEKVELNNKELSLSVEKLTHLRDDNPILPSEQSLCEQCAPQTISHFYIVPKVIEEE